MELSRRTIVDKTHYTSLSFFREIMSFGWFRDMSHLCSRNCKCVSNTVPRGTKPLGSNCEASLMYSGGGDDRL
jgi:hypothetical protein